MVIQHDPDMADRRLGSRIGEDPVELERAPSIYVDELGDDGVLVVPASALDLKLEAARRGVYRAPSAGFALFDQFHPVDRRVCPRAMSRRSGPEERKPESYRTNRGDGILLGQHYYTGDPTGVQRGTKSCYNKMVEGEAKSPASEPGHHGLTTDAGSVSLNSDLYRVLTAVERHVK
jgi:hypothetical protein